MKQLILEFRNLHKWDKREILLRLILIVFFGTVFFLFDTVIMWMANYDTIVILYTIAKFMQILSIFAIIKSIITIKETFEDNI